MLFSVYQQHGEYFQPVLVPTVASAPPPVGRQVVLHVWVWHTCIGPTHFYDNLFLIGNCISSQESGLCKFAGCFPWKRRLKRYEMSCIFNLFSCFCQSGLWQKNACSEKNHGNCGDSFKHGCSMHEEVQNIRDFMKMDICSELREKMNFFVFVFEFQTFCESWFDQDCDVHLLKCAVSVQHYLEVCWFNLWATEEELNIQYRTSFTCFIFK